MNHRLLIYYERRKIATLSEEGLCYENEWMDDPLTFPLSHSLPKQKAAHDLDRAWPWLVNLLPEGNARTRIAARLKISQDNDLQLLQALGSDCAGAVQIYVEEPAHTKSDQPVASYTRLHSAELQALATTPGSAASLLRGDVRMSLAGAQDKVPVRLCKDQLLWLPRNGAPSTHLLKCPNPSFSQLVVNEHFCLSLAQAVGLEVVHSQIISSPKGHRLLLIERFDRDLSSPNIAGSAHASTTELPWIKRLHQEDFAQALGRAHYQKYESEGGPTLAECVALLRSSAKRPAQEILQLLRWFIFCLVIGNRDNHAKNLARIFDQGHWKLAPFYDLVCTRAYDGIDKSLAMTIGTQRDLSRVNAKAWQAQARDCRLGHRIVLREVQDMCQKVKDALKPTRERVQSTHKLRSENLRPVIKAINKGLRVTEQDLY